MAFEGPLLSVRHPESLDAKTLSLVPALPLFKTRLVFGLHWPAGYSQEGSGGGPSSRVT